MQQGFISTIDTSVSMYSLVLTLHEHTRATSEIIFQPGFTLPRLLELLMRSFSQAIHVCATFPEISKSEKRIPSFAWLMEKITIGRDSNLVEVS